VSSEPDKTRAGLEEVELITRVFSSLGASLGRSDEEIPYAFPSGFEVLHVPALASASIGGQGSRECWCKGAVDQVIVDCALKATDVSNELFNGVRLLLHYLTGCLAERESESMDLCQRMEDTIRSLSWIKLNCQISIRQ
jgi:hypothetical protein